jgi:hypothetical protein
MNLTRILVFVSCFAFASIPLKASSAYVIDFGTGLLGSGGTITNTGASILGQNILIGSMVVQGTTSSDGTYEVDALLNFDTGANTISIVGDISSLGVFGDTFLDGSFATYSYNVYPGPTEVFDSTGPDTKSDALLGALGIPLDIDFGFFGFSIESANGTVTSTDIINTSVVPVPAAAWLFGSGLLALLGISRRKKAA